MGVGEIVLLCTKSFGGEVLEWKRGLIVVVRGVLVGVVEEAESDEMSLKGWPNQSREGDGKQGETRKAARWRWRLAMLCRRELGTHVVTRSKDGDEKGRC